MLVKIKDYDFLWEHRSEEPTINDNMLDMNGQTFEIDADTLEPDIWYNYKTWKWKGSWLIPLEKEITRSAFSLPSTDLDAFIAHLGKQTYPENLQNITFVSNDFTTEGTEVLGKSGVLLNYGPRTGRGVDPSVHIKFSNASAYNITRYFAVCDIGRDIYKQDERVNEDDIIATLESLGTGYMSFLEAQRNMKNIARFTKDGFQEFGASVYNTYSSYPSYASIVSTLAKTTRTLSVDLNVEFVDTPTDKDTLYMLAPYRDAFMTITEAQYHTYFYNLQIQTCPVLGIKYIGTDPMKRYMATTSLNGFNLVIVKRSSVSQEVFDDMYERLADSDHPWSSYGKAYYFMNRYYTKEQYESELERFAKFSQYHMEVNENNFTYNGSRFYFEDDMIQDYDYEPYIEFYGEYNDLHLGVELEIDRGGENQDNASIIMAPLGRYAYAMHDGSLNDGFEIATMPMTLNFAESIKDRFVDSMGVARLLDYKSHDTSTCGLHIHFDRSFLGASPRTQNLKASYLAIIMERNWEKMVEFSRRNYSRLDQWAKKMDLANDLYADDTDDDAQRKFNGKYGNGDKYVALNTAHHNTYELRIFKGTLKPETLFATMQFVDNLVRVAKECPSLAKAQQITFADIIDYKHHKELIEYVNTRGILTREYKEYEGE